MFKFFNSRIFQIFNKISSLLISQSDVVVLKKLYHCRMYTIQGQNKFKILISLIFLTCGSITINAQNNLGEVQSNQRNFAEIQNYKRVSKTPLVDENQIAFNFIKNHYSDLLKLEKERMQCFHNSNLNSKSLEAKVMHPDRRIKKYIHSHSTHKFSILQSTAYKKFRNSSQQSLKYLYENESRLKENKLKNQ